MAGVKGKSGVYPRKGRADQDKIAELADLSIKWAISNFDTLTMDQKLKVLTCVAVKYIPQHIEHSGELFKQSITIVQNADGTKKYNNRIDSEANRSEVVPH